MHIQDIIHHFGYIGVFFILFIEAIGFPFPAETTLTLSGIEWTHGVFRLFPLWLAAALGNIVGSTIAYFIGRYLGRPVILRFGRYIGINEARLDGANRHFQKYQWLVVVVGKFIAGIRILVPYLAGINGVRFWFFWPVNALSAIVWSGAFIISGHYIGIAFSDLWPYFRHHLIWAVLLVSIVVAALVVHEIRRRRKGS